MPREGFVMKKKLMLVILCSYFQILVPQMEAADSAHTPSGTTSTSQKPLEAIATQTLNISGRSFQVSPLGKGIRKKKIAFFSVQVYEAELFVSNISVFKDSLRVQAALEALGKMEAATIRLRFLRTLHSEQVRESFSDALKVNHADPSAPKMNEFFSKVAQTDSFVEEKSVSISADFTNGILAYQDQSGRVSEIRGDKKFVLEIFSIWLGVPADGGLASLQKLLVGG
jgi:hypothetical protein